MSNNQYSIFFVLFFSSFLSVLSVGEVKAGACYQQNNPSAGCVDVDFCVNCTNTWCEQDTNCADLVKPLPPEDGTGAPPPASTKGLKGASGRLENLGGKAGLAGTKSLEEAIGGFIKGALVLVGTIFLVLMVYGGYIWMIARGDEAEAKRAKGIIETAVIGIAIVLAAYAVTYFVVYRLTQATGAGL